MSWLCRTWLLTCPSGRKLVSSRYQSYVAAALQPSRQTFRWWDTRRSSWSLGSSESWTSHSQSTISCSWTGWRCRCDDSFHLSDIPEGSHHPHFYSGSFFPDSRQSKWYRKDGRKETNWMDVMMTIIRFRLFGVWRGKGLYGIGMIGVMMTETWCYLCS